MKNILKISVIFIVLFFLGCKEEENKPKVIYKKPTIKNVSVADSAQILIADLPIQMPETNYLIHPIAAINISDRTVKSSSNQNKISFKISNYGDSEITGYLQNLKFQEINSDSIKTLTEKPVLIQNVTYLKSVFNNSKQQVLVYVLIDSDTNLDGKLDENDIKSLYISEISGVRFTKISLDFQELIDWNLIESKSYLYFRTVEDTNKNGKFDKNDLLHYHFIDLSNKDWKISDYNPI